MHKENCHILRSFVVFVVARLALADHFWYQLRAIIYHENISNRSDIPAVILFIGLNILKTKQNQKTQTLRMCLWHVMCVDVCIHVCVCVHTTIILVSTDSALIRQYKCTSLKKCKLNFTYRGKFPQEKKGANIPQIFDGNSIKANQTPEW